MLKSSYGVDALSVAFRFPNTILSVTSKKFDGLAAEEREQQIARDIDLSLADFRKVVGRLYLRVAAVAPSETARAQVDRGFFWPRLLLDDAKVSRDATTESPPVLHFYGHKGGQARSTVLAFLGRALSGRGWKVLAVDVDAEAPSLDALFGAPAPSPASTLLGARAGLTLEPYRVFTPQQGTGYVDLVAFRPQGADFDFDAAVLAMELAMAPPASEDLIEDVASLRASYDVMLLDHRSGLGATVPPWVRCLPGPVVAFARMDGQWRQAQRHFRALWMLNPFRPGALVSFKPDDESDASYIRRNLGQARSAIEGLVDAVNSGAEPDTETTTPDDLFDHWVLWPYDPALRAERPATVRDVGIGVRTAIEELERLLGVEGEPPNRTEAAAPPPTLHPSGAQDQGDLIVTQALKELRAPTSPLWFVTGRKGTGKTRLLRELARNGRGKALLVAEGDKGSDGIAAAHPALTLLLRETAEDAEAFWWVLIVSALASGTKRTALVGEIERWVDRLKQDESPLRALQELAQAQSEPTVYLVDGLETAFPRKKTHYYIAALLRVWSTLESDDRLKRGARVRVFVRTDLARRGFENFEQQSYGRTLELRWNTQYILNFALTRMRARQWYRTNFPDAMAAIDKEHGKILMGALEVSRCDELFLRVFPDRLRRQNMLTTTFLRTWFSDDPSAEHGYYPRIYDEFLRTIAEPYPQSEFIGSQIEEGRISQELIFHAHEKATVDFLAQVKVELRNLVDLDEAEISQVMDAFKQTITPFSVAKMTVDLATRTTISEGKIRQTLEQMKALGVFEVRPGHAGQWRAGRLFKTSLGMLYNRKRKSRDGAGSLP